MARYRTQPFLKLQSMVILRRLDKISERCSIMFSMKPDLAQVKLLVTILRGFSKFFKSTKNMVQYAERHHFIKKAPAKLSYRNFMRAIKRTVRRAGK